MISSGDQFDRAARDMLDDSAFLGPLFDMVNQRETDSCATSHQSQNIVISCLPSALTCFPSTCATGLPSSTDNTPSRWPPSKNPLSITCSATLDWRQLPLSRHAEYNGAIVDQQYCTDLMLWNRLHATICWRRICAHEVVLHTYKLRILPQYLLHGMCVQYLCSVSACRCMCDAQQRHL
jgi:hypothetical protein